MFKKMLLAFVSLFAMMNFAFAAVDVNKADQAALDGIKGLGPVKSKLILAERAKGGDFKNWADFEARVKGIAAKSAANLSAAGLTVNGLARDAAAPSAMAAATAASGARPSASAAAASQAASKK